jgi:tetratricopeptide (TPR) repeat protein
MPYLLAIYYNENRVKSLFKEKKMAEPLRKFEKYITQAISSLKSGDLELAEENIKQAMAENPHSPAVHNLYGILEEFLKDDNLAHKHYRVAYTLDPTYKPAINNLERISTLEERARKQPIDFGDQIVASDEEALYVVEYDNHHVGHLRRR